MDHKNRYAHANIETQSTFEVTLPPIKNPSFRFLNQKSPSSVAESKNWEGLDPIINTESLQIRSKKTDDKNILFLDTPPGSTENVQARNSHMKSSSKMSTPYEEDEKYEQSPLLSRAGSSLRITPSDIFKNPYEDTRILNKVYKENPRLVLDVKSNIQKTNDQQTSFRSDPDLAFKQEMFKELFEAQNERRGSADQLSSGKKTLLHMFLKALLNGEIRNRSEAQKYIDLQLNEGVVVMKHSRANSSASSEHRYVLSRPGSRDFSQSTNLIPTTPDYLQPSNRYEIPQRKKSPNLSPKNEIVVPRSDLDIKPTFEDLNLIEIESESSDIEISQNMSYNDILPDESTDNIDKIHRRTVSFTGKLYDQKKKVKNIEDSKLSEEVKKPKKNEADSKKDNTLIIADTLKVDLELQPLKSRSLGQSEAKYLKADSVSIKSKRRGSFQIKNKPEIIIKDAETLKPEILKLKQSKSKTPQMTLTKSPSLSMSDSLSKQSSLRKTPSPSPSGKLKKKIKKKPKNLKSKIKNSSDINQNPELEEDTKLKLENDNPEDEEAENDLNQSVISQNIQSAIKEETSSTEKSPNKSILKPILHVKEGHILSERDLREHLKSPTNNENQKSGSSSPVPHDRMPIMFDENGYPIPTNKRKFQHKPNIEHISTSDPPKSRIRPVDQFINNFSKSLLQTVSILVVGLKNDISKAQPLLETVDPFEIIARRKKATRKINKVKQQTRIELQKQITLKEEYKDSQNSSQDMKINEIIDEEIDKSQSELKKAKTSLVGVERVSSLRDENKKATNPDLPKLEKEKSNFGINKASKYFSKTVLLNKVAVPQKSMSSKKASALESEYSDSESAESDISVMEKETARKEKNTKPLNVAYDRSRASVQYELQNYNLVSQMAKHILGAEDQKPKILAQPTVSEFFKKLVPEQNKENAKSAKNDIPESEEELEEEVDLYANALDVNEELMNMFFGKTTNIKKFVFTPQVQFKFPQKYDVNQDSDINDIELANFNIDQENFEASMLKKRFYELSKFLPTYDAYLKKQNGLLFMIETNDMHPKESITRRIKEFDKKRKKERELRLRGKNKVVEIGGKPKKTFTNLDDKGQFTKNSHKEKIKTKLTDFDIIKSGGANEVEDELEREERLYCRIKGNFDLNALKVPQKRSIGLSKSVRNLFHNPILSSTRSQKHMKIT